MYLGGSSTHCKAGTGPSYYYIDNTMTHAEFYQGLAESCDTSPLDFTINQVCEFMFSLSTVLGF
jgi:hypothetical protein